MSENTQSTTLLYETALVNLERPQYGHMKVAQNDEKLGFNKQGIANQLS